MLGNWLRRTRRARGLTQDAIGRAVGLDQPQISRIETGDRAATAEEFLALLLVLGVHDVRAVVVDAAGIGLSPGLVAPGRPGFSAAMAALRREVA